MPLSRVATPILPSRYDEVLNQRVADHARALLAAAKPSSTPLLRLPRWAVPALVIGAGLLVVGTLLSRDSERQPTKVPFAKTNVISTGAVGLQASAEDLIGPSTSPHPVPSPESTAGLLPSKASSPDDDSLHPRAAIKARPIAGGGSMSMREQRPQAPLALDAPGSCPTCKNSSHPQLPTGTVEPATEVLEERGSAYAADMPALPSAPERVVTVGTRVPAKLTHGTVTSFGGAPLTAVVQQDVIVAGETLILAGTLLAGDAFGTNLDDRAQVAFSAMVLEGHSVHFRGLGMGSDGRLGLTGRVIHRASAPKHGVGRLLGSVGSAFAGGLAGEVNGGVLGGAGINLATGLATDLTQLDRTWATERSDKAIELPAGALITVYVETDVKVR